MHGSVGNTFVSRPLRLPCNAFLATYRARDIFSSQRTTRSSATRSKIHVRGEAKRGCRQKGARIGGPSCKRSCFGFQSTFIENLNRLISIPFQSFFTFRYRTFDLLRVNKGKDSFAHRGHCHNLFSRNADKNIQKIFEIYT